MRRKQRFYALMLLLGGVLAGVLLASQMNWLPNSAASEMEPVIATVPADAAETVRDLNTAFTAIAGEANKSVVTIFVDKFVSPQRHPFRFNPFGDMFGDDFFERFFQQPGPDEERRLRGMGSGVLVSADGYILTNNHVVREADQIQVMLHTGKRIDAKIIGTDAKTDLAVLKIEHGELQPLKLGDSEALQVGEWVLAIGSPLSENLAHTITAGIVSAKGRSNLGLADYEDFIQTDAAINRGNSGGALVDLNGRLVGINTAILSQSGGFQGIGFAVPINMARQVMEALIKDGKVIRGWLGVYIQNVDANIARAMNLPDANGALVSTVSEGSPAEKAGLQPGDVILAMNGEKVRDVTTLRNSIAAQAPGTTVTLKIWRDGQEKDINIELGRLPDEEPVTSSAEGVFDKIGFSVQTIDEQMAGRLGYDRAIEGVVITQINQTSAAFSAGLRQGDVIKSVNRQPIKTASQFNDLVRGMKSGDTMLVYAERRQNRFFAAFEVQ